MFLDYNTKQAWDLSDSNKNVILLISFKNYPVNPESFRYELKDFKIPFKTILYKLSLEK